MFNLHDLLETFGISSNAIFARIKNSDKLLSASANCMESKAPLAKCKWYVHECTRAYTQTIRQLCSFKFFFFFERNYTILCKQMTDWCQMSYSTDDDDDDNGCDDKLLNSNKQMRLNRKWANWAKNDEFQRPNLVWGMTKLCFHWFWISTLMIDCGRLDSIRC